MLLIYRRAARFIRAAAKRCLSAKPGIPHPMCSRRLTVQAAGFIGKGMLKRIVQRKGLLHYKIRRTTELRRSLPDSLHIANRGAHVYGRDKKRIGRVTDG